MPSNDNEEIHLVFLPLLTVNAQGELEPQLAQSWEHSADYRDWTYHLRPGVRWHDGVPVPAADVKFTPELLCQQAAIGFSATDSPDHR
jgi:peptide/nickel transport system substrate-binding protein